MDNLRELLIHNIFDEVYENTPNLRKQYLDR